MTAAPQFRPALVDAGPDNGKVRIGIYANDDALLAECTANPIDVLRLAERLATAARYALEQQGRLGEGSR